jgi:hypothetical protein
LNDSLRPAPASKNQDRYSERYSEIVRKERGGDYETGLSSARTHLSYFCGERRPQHHD